MILFNVSKKYIQIGKEEVYEYISYSIEIRHLLEIWNNEEKNISITFLLSWLKMKKQLYGRTVSQKC